MLSEERYQKITERVGRNGSATVNELANECGVSIETIRRDLVFLEAHGRLKRVFGGAVAHRAAPRFEEYPVREFANREQKIAVGNVILNRVEHPSFPNTIAGVVYQPGAFTCMVDGQFNEPVADSAYRAAQDALNGADPSGGAIYYFNPDTATSAWIWSRPLIKTIGKHRFCA